MNNEAGCKVPALPAACGHLTKDADLLTSSTSGKLGVNVNNVNSMPKCLDNPVNKQNYYTISIRSL